MSVDKQLEQEYMIIATQAYEKQKELKALEEKLNILANMINFQKDLAKRGEEDGSV